MRLSYKQKENLCKRYWTKGESFETARNRKGFATLRYNDFLLATDTKGPYFKPEYLKKPKYNSLEWLDKPDDNGTGFAESTEKEIFDRLCRQKGNAHNVVWK